MGGSKRVVTYVYEVNVRLMPLVSLGDSQNKRTIY